MKGNFKIEPSVPVEEMTFTDVQEDQCQDPPDLRATPSYQAENQPTETARNSSESEEIADKLPDVDLKTFQVFSVGGPQTMLTTENGTARDGFGGSNHGKPIRQKRLSVSSKVGHVELENTRADSDKTETSLTTESEKKKTDSTNIKTNRNIWVSLKRKLRNRRGKRETIVKEIHILPEEGEDKWANRSFSDHSNTSSNDSRSGSSGSRSSSQRTAKEATFEVMLGKESIDQDNLYNPEKR
ncbi:hypothetical protein PoB_004103200 [Plakobranchus ocellatus]|uniref:Uncharacterized protein n=1 Tax=Plakobranchus ocellatus TaxID=259542 RepID=A0AAV4B4U2_9GAST|nr:hypothetical protein PoB_004103200 [Plakobranchus ocellatus]